MLRMGNRLLANKRDSHVTSGARNFVLFKTDLFVFRQRDEDIDKWRVGGDCAGWFYVRLLLAERIQHYCEPVMEDWGWTFAVSVDGVRVCVNVWAFYEIENCWLFGLEPKRRLFQRQSPETLLETKEAVCDALAAIMMADPRIVRSSWFAENPFQQKINDF
jgi:hypothetical protein